MPKVTEPAILSLIEERWIHQALNNYFSKGRDILYFSSNSVGIKPAASLNIKHVYFKLKGTPYISWKANFVGFTERIPSEFRLPGYENELAKYYYGFNRPERLESYVHLTDLKY